MVREAIERVCLEVAGERLGRQLHRAPERGPTWGLLEGRTFSQHIS
jgi:hypothetical protein